MQMKNRVIIVAGSAMGIGKATVHRFAKDVANVMFFLASDDAGYVTGQNYSVDG